MLALDHGRTIPYQDFISKRASGYPTIFNDLATALKDTEFKPIKTSLNIFYNQQTRLLSIEKLHEYIKKNGPAIVRIQPLGSLVAHWIIVDDYNHDSVLRSSVTIRDPWHGWCIDIDKYSFIIPWENAFKLAQEDDFADVDHIIQVSKK